MKNVSMYRAESKTFHGQIFLNFKIEKRFEFEKDEKGKRTPT